MTVVTSQLYGCFYWLQFSYVTVSEETCSFLEAKPFFSHVLGLMFAVEVKTSYGQSRGSDPVALLV